jgi:hypothetical protein
MRSQMHVEIEPVVHREGAVVISAQVNGHPRRRNRNGKIWIEAPAERLEWLAIQGNTDDLHDAFLRMLILSAMEANCDLVIHGNVSSSLLANMERWQDIVSRWWPTTYRRVDLVADREVDTPTGMANTATAETLQAFSGGLDSVESLYGHKLRRRGRNTRNVTACLLVHGFDIDYNDQRFGAAWDRTRRLCEPCGVELLRVRTNLKQMLPCWTACFPTGVAAMLSLFQRKFSVGQFAASVAYEDPYFIATGSTSTAMTDHLLSSSSFQVIQDLAITRMDKTMSLRDHPEVWKLLRVCWEGEDPTTNCGKCEKCIRQMLCMLAAGVEDFSGFQSPPTAQSIASVTPHHGAVEREWQVCLAMAEAEGRGNRPEFQAMRAVLQSCAAASGESSDAIVPPPHSLKRRIKRLALRAFAKPRR